MSGPRTTRWSIDRRRILTAACVAVLVGVHLLVSLRHLDVVPVAHPDEPLLASAASTVAEEGRLAAPFREGLAGSEDHLYAWLPVHPLLLAGWFRLVGVGLFETRVFSVLASAGVLVLTFLLGRRLAGGSVGLLAVVLVVATRILWEGPVTPTGITLLDVSRVGRYDPLVALFGLATVLAYMAGRDAPTPGRGWFVLTGVAAMLSALSNAYGLAFLAGVVLVSVADGTWRRAVPWLAVGAAGPAVAYLVHALQDPAGWQAQMELAVRGDLRPWDLLGNLVAERHRYAPGLGAFGWRWLARPGFWAAMIAVPSAVVWLLSRARRGDRDSRLLVIVLVVVAGSLALITARKTTAYGVATTPLAAVAVAMAAVQVWRSGGDRAMPWVRAGLLVVLAAVVVEGASRVVHVDRLAAETTPYRAAAEQLAAATPGEGPVLVLPRWWFAFQNDGPRSWLVPLSEVGDASGERAGGSIVTQLDALSPAVVVIDADMRAYLASRPALADSIRGWLTAQGFHATTIRDPTYGAIELHTRPDDAVAGRAPTLELQGSAVGGSADP